MRIKLWDLPTRLCHWLLFACVAGAFVTQKIGGTAMLWHGRFGLAVLGLVTFRIIWGFCGSTYARFASFVRGPGALRAYFQGRWQGIGHNPLGAFSVLALLGVLLWLASTGLFANDDIAFEGPLYRLVDTDCSDWITALHKGAEPVLIALVGLHIAAIAYYARVKKKNLLVPMITGYQDNPPAEAQSAQGGGVFALLFAVMIALAVVFAASGLWTKPEQLKSPTPQSAPAQKPVAPSW